MKRALLFFLIFLVASAGILLGQEKAQGGYKILYFICQKTNPDVTSGWMNDSPKRSGGKYIRTLAPLRTFFSEKLKINPPLRVSQVSTCGFLYLTLEESVKIALENNPSVKRADAEIRQYSYKVQEIQRGYMPKLEFNSSYMRTEPVNELELNNTKVSIGDINNYLLKLTLNQLIYTFGRIESSEVIAKLNLEYSKLACQRIKQDLILQTKTGYFNILRAQRYVKVAEKSVQSSQSHLKTAQDFYSEGIVARYDVLKMETNLSQSQQELIKAENSLELSIKSFKNILNLNDNVKIEVEDVEEETDDISFVKDEDSSIKLGLLNRPDAKQIAVNLNVAEKAVILASTERNPNLALAYNYNWRNKTAISIDKNWDATLLLNVPIFEGGVVQSKVQQSKESLKQMEAISEEIKNAITLEIRQACLNLNEAKKMLEVTQKNVAQAEEALSIAEVRYQSSISTATELSDSQLARDFALFSYWKALYDYKIALAAYKKAIGYEAER